MDASLLRAWTIAHVAYTLIRQTMFRLAINVLWKDRALTSRGNSVPIADTDSSNLKIKANVHVAHYLFVGEHVTINVSAPFSVPP